MIEPCFAGLFLTLALVWAVFPVGQAHAAAPSIERGEIEGAHYALMRPTRWNGSVLLLAHGVREETSPLVADLFPDRLAYKTLISEGWIVAKTSYRRNGVILADAIKDLDNLRAFIANKIGKPKRVIIEGDSMGGTIATLIAERDPADPALYQGAVAIDAALDLRDPQGGITGLAMQTKMPLIFLSNQNELAGARAYVSTLMPGDARTIPPALLRVSRDGHVNVNQQERLVALRSLIAWTEQGRTALPKPAEGQPYFDATQIPAPIPSLVTFDSDQRSFTAKVTEVTEVYGNVAIDAQPDDFAKIGVGKNAFFQVLSHGNIYRVQFGKNFNLAKRGDWIAFPNADGFFWLARVYGNAAEAAKWRSATSSLFARTNPARRRLLQANPNDSTPGPRPGFRPSSQRAKRSDGARSFRPYRARI